MVQISELSNPVTAISFGTDIPIFVSSLITVYAILSLEHTIASSSRGFSPIRMLSARMVESALVLKSKSPETTMLSSYGISYSASVS